MTHTTAQPGVELKQLRQSVAQLQEVVRLLEKERAEFMNRRFRRLLLFGVGLSVVFHLGLMIYLSMVQRAGAPGDGGGGAFANVEFAIVNDQELTKNEETTFDDLETDPTAAKEALDESASPLQPDVGTASAAASSDASLGASGSGEGGGLGLGGSGGAGGDSGFGLGGGGGGGTSFFGVGGKGQRFAYIVDISGSMGQSHKLDIAMRELARSIETLPDFAYFHILLFETKTIQPPGQNGWMRARKSAVRQVVGWLRDVEPNGGTEPRNAFMQVFALDQRPDVIFFLTDGIFNDISLEELNALNAKGKKVVMNTIGFGTPGEVDQTILRAIASQSGGQYRFVSTEKAP